MRKSTLCLFIVVLKTCEINVDTDLQLKTSDYENCETSNSVESNAQIEMQLYENTPIQIHGKFHLEKTEIFQIKN